MHKSTTAISTNQPARRTDRSITRSGLKPDTDHWSVSYLDLLTLLLTLFVLLFALQKQAEKQQLEEQAAAAVQAQLAAERPITVAYSGLPRTLTGRPGEQASRVSGNRIKTPGNTLQAPLYASMIPAAHSISSTRPEPGHATSTARGRQSIPDKLALRNEPAGQKRHGIPLTIARLPAEPPESPDNKENQDIRQIIDTLKSSALADAVSISNNRNTATLEMKNHILFAPGQASVLAGGQRFLQQLASSLQDRSLQISIEGHTDNQPIRNSRYGSNWELSTARAVAVTHALIDMGIDATRIRATGRADTLPVTTNDSPQGRRQNRRVTIILEPREPTAVASTD